MTKQENQYILNWVKKIKAIEMLGGKCQECGEDRPWVLSFHHKNPDNKISIDSIKTYRWSVLKKEIKKCIVLCHNCHREIHKNFNKLTIYDKSKQYKLDYKNIYKCEICGYDKYIGGLDFHHKKDKLLKLNMVHIFEESCLEVKEKIENEINKCIVLCANCHQNLHFDKDRFEKYKDVIYNYDYKEKQKPADVNTVLKMYKEGKKQIEIAKELGYAKTTICGIIKKYYKNECVAQLVEATCLRRVK